MKRRAFKLRPARGGFSLVELIVVMTIVGILGTMAVSKYSEAINRYRAQEIGLRIVTDLALAQSVGKTSSAGQSVAFDVTNNQYTMAGYSSPMSGPAQATYTVNLSISQYNATLVSASFGGSATITYDRFGQPSSGGTVVVKVGTARTVTVTVDANTGKATMQ